MDNVIIMFWVADILNLPFMEMFDTTYPLNGLFWFLVFLFWCSSSYVRTKGDK